jgi:DNA-binding GntR family transcriptional regulator
VTAGMESARSEHAANSPALVPVDRETTPSVIARRLRAAITSGTLPQGSQLVETDLARELNVSRGPVREAMQRLTQEGLVRSVRSRGLFVVTLSPADIQDIYFARLTIEHAAGQKLSADHLLDRVVPALRECLGVMAAAGRDAAAAADADLRFHELLVTSAASPRLTRMHATLLAEARMCLAALAPSYQAEEGRVAEHAAIVEALRSSDEAELVRALQAHADHALARLVPAAG